MRFISLVILLYLILPVQLHAQSISTIRDEETEDYLREISYPIFRTGGLHAENIQMIIVQSNELNAFVAGGQNMFIHTAIITESDDPNLLQGVIAHETGHIVGGHLIRKTQEMENAATQGILGTILGVGAIAAGAGDLGMAIMSGSQHIAARDFLKHSRGHEQSRRSGWAELYDQARYFATRSHRIVKNSWPQARTYSQRSESLCTDAPGVNGSCFPFGSGRFAVILTLTNRHLKH